MGILDRFRRRKKERKGDIQKTEVNTPQKTKETIKRTEDKRIEKTKILEGYKVKDASAHKLPWQDEASQRAEELLKKKGIQIHWHYNDTFGENFKVLALRAGGVGAVFFVKSTRFGERIYAAKTLQQFLQKDYLEMPTYQQKKIADDFLEEALPWLEMGQHSNIVPVHLLESIIHPTTRRNVPFVFSEFMEEGDLKNLLKEKGRFELEEALSVGLQVCEALLHAYKHGLSAHKDLKPENIMVYKEGIYKVTDFSAGVLGTPGYMAPEQVASHFELQDNIAIDQRADQFAIGIIMLELFLGEHPFPGIIRAAYSKEEAKKFLRVGAGEIPDNLPGSLRGMIERCLSPDPANRFHGLSSLKEALLEGYRTEFGEYRFPEVEIDDSPEWWSNRGEAFCTIGHSASAEIPFKEALRRFIAIHAEKDQARCIMNLGGIYLVTGEPLKAEANLKEALKMFKAILGTEEDQTTCLMNLGNVYWGIGEPLKAEANFKKALRMFKAIPGTEIDQAMCLVNLGNAYQSIGKLPEAEAKFKKALEMFKVEPGMEANQARCLICLGSIYQSIGKLPEAEASLKEALRTFKAIPGTELGQAGCLANLGRVYQSMGKLPEAEANSKKALELFKAIPGTEHPQAGCLVNLGSVYWSIGEPLKAEANLKKALELFKAILGTEEDQARCLMNLGILNIGIQEFREARSVLKDALEICEQYPMGTEQIKNACLQLLSKIP